MKFSPRFSGLLLALLAAALGVGRAANPPLTVFPEPRAPAAAGPPGPQPNASNASFQYDAIVIGAGIAGLAAAQNLTRSGLRVLVLEARNRTGGRLHSVPTKAGAWCRSSRVPPYLPWPAGKGMSARSRVLSLAHCSIFCFCLPPCCVQFPRTVSRTHIHIPPPPRTPCRPPTPPSRPQS
jgi:hypothetical protein